MQAIMEILEKLETLIYKILIWIILIPKTLLQVVLHPDWAPSYITQELGEGKSRFDEYFSPVVLLLVVAIVPFLIWNFLPVPGVEVTSPSIESPSTARRVDFNANIKFISTSTDGFVTTFWRVEKELYDGTTYHFPVVAQSRYTNNPQEINRSDYYNFKQIDNHTLQDFYNYEFSEPGNYWVVLDASKFDADGYLLESYHSDINVFIPPQDSQENVIVYARTKPQQTDNRPLVDRATDQLKNEKTIFMALGLLIPPLLFSLAIKLFSKSPLSEDNLKETFYVQCYYFAPLAFIYWATRYAIQFFTPDVFFRYDTELKLIVLLPIMLAIFWFLSVQTHAVSREAKISGGPALLIVLVCMFILGAGILFVVYNNQPDLQDATRKSSIWIYPLLAVGLLTAYHILSVIQKRRQNLAISRGDKALVGGIMFIIFTTMCLVLVVGGRSIPLHSTELDTIQKSIADESMAQLISFQEEKFSSEEFDGSLDAWFAITTWGEEGTYDYASENGRLHVQLFQTEDQEPSDVYFIKSDFVYTDVQIETSTTETGSNAYSVSMVCRVSDLGWYEFEVSNFGYYRIYAYDTRAFTELAAGEMPVMNSGESENMYTAICKGNELSLVVNGIRLAIVQDTQFNFMEGQIGIGVYSAEGLPVNIDFEYVRLSEPSSEREMSATEDAPVPVSQVLPTEPPVSNVTKSYTEEFDGNLDAWQRFVGDENFVSIVVENGALAFRISPSDVATQGGFIINPASTYADVQLEAAVTNNGNNANQASLICRYRESGWYEFNVSNGGDYSIYAVDTVGSVKQGYNLLTNGGSALITPGHVTNVYTAICKGSELSLYVNGTLVETIEDTGYNFTEGYIGIGASTSGALPVDLQFEAITVSEPQ